MTSIAYRLRTTTAILMPLVCYQQHESALGHVMKQGGSTLGLLNAAYVQL